AGYSILYYPGFSPDLSLIFYDDYSDPRIEFTWNSTNWRKIRDVGRKIECWNQYENGTRTKDFGIYRTFKYSYYNGNNPYTTFPIDPRQKCNLGQYPVQNNYFQQNDVGVLTLNLTIEKNDANGNPVEITTPTLAPFQAYSPPPIKITDGATLTLAKGSNNQERRLVFKKYSTGYYGT